MIRFDRTHLLVVALAIVGALGGLGLGMWLRPTVPLAIRPSRSMIGQPRPALELPDLEGRKQSLAQWDGRLMLVNFWASWCAPCVEEMPLLDRARQRYAASGLQIVGIA